MDLFTIGESLRKSRQAAGLTQAEVASSAGISRSTYSLLESGTVPDLGVRKVLAIVDRLDLALEVNRRPGPPSLAEVYAANKKERRETTKQTSEIIRQALDH